MDPNFMMYISAILFFSFQLSCSFHFSFLVVFISVINTICNQSGTRDQLFVVRMLSSKVAHPCIPGPEVQPRRMSSSREVRTKKRKKIRTAFSTRHLLFIHKHDSYWCYQPIATCFGHWSQEKLGCCCQ